MVRREGGEGSVLVNEGKLRRALEGHKKKIVHSLPEEKTEVI